MDNNKKTRRENQANAFDKHTRTEQVQLQSTERLSTVQECKCAALRVPSAAMAMQLNTKDQNEF